MENLGPPLPQIKDEKWRFFSLHTASSLIWRGMRVCCSILFCPRLQLRRWFYPAHKATCTGDWGLVSYLGDSQIYLAGLACMHALWLRFFVMELFNSKCEWLVWFNIVHLERNVKVFTHKQTFAASRLFKLHNFQLQK